MRLAIATAALAFVVPSQAQEQPRDVCTYIAVTTQTTQMCYTENVCYKSSDGTKDICTGHQPTLCNSFRAPAYECKRADGTTYIWEDPDILTISPGTGLR